MHASPAAVVAAAVVVVLLLFCCYFGCCAVVVVVILVSYHCCCYLFLLDRNETSLSRSLSRKVRMIIGLRLPSIPSAAASLLTIMAGRDGDNNIDGGWGTQVSSGDRSSSGRKNQK